MFKQLERGPANDMFIGSSGCFVCMVCLGKIASLCITLLKVKYDSEIQRRRNQSLSLRISFTNGSNTLRPHSRSKDAVDVTSRRLHHSFTARPESTPNSSVTPSRTSHKLAGHRVTFGQPTNRPQIDPFARPFDPSKCSRNTSRPRQSISQPTQHQ